MESRLPSSGPVPEPGGDGRFAFGSKPTDPPGMPSYDFDAVVVGGGSAGYAAARTLAAGGVRAAVIDGAPELGGLCILRGCMPTKALLQAAQLRHNIEQARDWGIHAGPVTVDRDRLFARKDELIAEFAKYRRGQLESGRFELVRSSARFRNPHELELDGGLTLTAGHTIIATGSRISCPSIPGLAEAEPLNSDTALRGPGIPDSVAVLGGGAVALEFAQFYARLGSKVTLIQRGPHVLRDGDPDVARELEKALRREGIAVHTSTRLVRIESTRGPDAERSHRIFFEEGSTRRTVEVAAVFNGLGRQPNIETLDLAAAGVAVEDNRIVTNLRQATTIPHIYAAGDCCGPHEVVHIAIQQGEIAARNILHPGNPQEMDYRLLTTVVFTDPAVAQVGMTEIEARAGGREVRTATSPFNDHGKSMILGSQDGFVKLVADARSGELLGGACVGPEGGELIHEITVALAARMTAAQFAAIPHYHPTLAEIWTYPAEELAETIGNSKPV